MLNYCRAVALALCLLPSLLHAATLTVGVGKQYTTINAAISASRNRDTILVDPGLYAEDVDFKGKSVVLKSTNGAASTTIAGTSYAIYMHTAETADTRVEGFTLRSNGSYTLRIESANPTFANCIVRDAKSGQSYAAYFSGANAVLSNVTFTANKTSYNLYITGSTLNISGATFSDNTAAYGGGVHITSSSKVAISNAVFSNNKASNYGGSIYVYNSGPVTVDNFKIYGGAAATGSGGNASYGGGIYLESNTDSVRFSNGHIANNYATYGAGLYNYNTTLHVNDVAFADNVGAQGGAVYLNSYSRSAFVNNTFVLNDANQGGAIYQYNTSDVLLLQNIFSQSTSGHSLYNNANTARSIAWYNLFYDNYPGNFAGVAENVIGERGNIQGDPLLSGFVDDRDPSNDDFTVDSDSPAIDAGSEIFLDEDESPSDLGVGGGDEDARPVTGDFTVTPFATGSELTSLTKALAAASSGQKIIVYPGVQYGNYDFNGKNVEIISAYGPATALMAGTGNTLVYDTNEDARSLVDGFTIWSSGGSYSTYVVGALPRFRNNHYRYNYASYVAYVYNNNSLSSTGVVSFDNCVWEDNISSYTLYVQAAPVTVLANSFINNKVSYGGGIAAASTASITVQNSLFEGNQSASYYGGGIYGSSATSIVVDNCRFYKNKATYGGGIYFDSLSGMSRVSNSVFSQNTATYGGGIYNYNSSTYINDNALTDNTATQGGAMYMNSYAHAAILNNTMVSNDAGSGGGIYAYQYSDLLLLQNIISKTTGGSALFFQSPAARMVAWYNLFYQNSPADSNPADRSPVGVRGNINADPKLTGFSDDNNYTNDTFTPASGSPAINGGSPNFVDADGSAGDIGVGGSDDSARPVSGHKVVAAIGTAGYSSLVAAVSAAAQGEKIVVYPGVYYGTVTPGGKNIQIVSAYGPEETVLSASSTAVSYASNEDNRSLLDGFTLWTVSGSYALYTYNASPVIQNCHFRYNTSYASYSQGGTVVYTSGVWEDNSGSYTAYTHTGTYTFTNPTFRNNSISYGGGISIVSSARVTVTGGTFDKNKASTYGGGIYMAGGSGLFVDTSTFTSNSATHGGGIYFESGTVISRVSGSFFGLNKATYGGGIYNYNTTVYANDNRMVENQGTSQGGAYYLNSYARQAIMNNTMVGNSSGQGGGVYAYNSLDALLANSIIAYNSDGEGLYVNAASARVTVTHSDFFQNYDPDFGGVMATQIGKRGNLGVDPKFVAYSRDGNLGNDNLALASFSPLINAGIAAFPDADGSASDMGFGGGDDTKRATGYAHSVSPYGGTDHATLAAAISAASNGQSIAVYPGVYYGDINFGGKDLKIVGVRGPLATVAASTSYGVQVSNGEGSGTFEPTFQGIGVHVAGTYGSYVVNSRVSFVDTHFRFGTSSYAGYFQNSTVNMNKALYEDNKVSYVAYYYNKSKGTVTDSTFQNNTASYGGGLTLSTTADVDVIRARIAGNVVSTYGGGIYTVGTSVLDVRDSVISQNKANYGGGIYAENTKINMSGTLVDRNSATTYGGGVYGYYCDDIYKNNILQNNTASQGGGVYLSTNCRMAWTNNNVVENSAGTGGGFHVVSGASLYSINNIVAYQTGGEGFSVPSGANFDIRYNDVFSNYKGPIAGQTTTLPSTNITVNPQFVTYSQDGNPANDDQHLADGSPCINTGDPTLTDVTDGSRSDIGAYGGSGLPALDADGDGFTVSQGDCNDNDATIYPGAPELLDGKDNDCNGTGDDPFIDQDGDGFSFEEGDCDDANAAIYPGASEACDGKDNDCDASVDEGVSTTYYRDADGDAYGTSTNTTQACTRPTGYASSAGDCNDANASINPGATEKCNGVDDNCNGQTDESGGTTWYRDVDGDGYGVSSSTLVQCAQPSGYVAQAGDCNDSNIAINPGASEVCDGVDNDCDSAVDDGVLLTWYRDADGDSYGTSATTQTSCTAPSGYVSTAGDCNDADANIKPGATEVCDGVDNDCDAQIDEGLTTQTWYRDADSDGYGTSSQTQAACTQPAGYVSTGGDCNDSNAAIKPGATEVCDGVDNNCNSQTDEGLTTKTWYTDSDGDGFGNTSTAQVTCSQPSGTVDKGGDCNDNNAAVSPSATEVCDKIDNDCDGSTDEGLTTTTYYLDADGDTYGTSSVAVNACAQPSGYVSRGGDCDDNNAATNPGASEQCDQIDNDCDGAVDDGITTKTWYLDGDGDGYGTNTQTRIACAQPSGYVDVGGDCNDASAAINPGATEVCDNTDNDCDGQRDEGFDKDGDGYYTCISGGKAADCNDNNAGINPGATEVCDGADNDCDGAVDEDGDTKFYEDKDGDAFGAGSGVLACSKPSGYASVAGDCNDNNGTIYPGATELCDDLDNDCDGSADEGLSQTWYLDADGDTWGVTNQTTSDCAQPSGYTSRGGDCNDAAASINPGATEVCDGIDNNCTGGVDEGFDQDSDGVPTCQVGSTPADCDDTNAEVSPTQTEKCDGFDNNCNSVVDEVVDGDGDGVTGCAGDCDDSNSAAFPGATEVCDGADNNCNGTTDEGFDGDGDTWYQCASGDKPVDCDDSNASANPGATETCDGVDNDCDGLVDEQLTLTWCFDSDGDGYGDPDDTAQLCAATDGYTRVCTDPDDDNGDTFPGAEEIPDGEDNDGDGQVDEDTTASDDDGDGYTEDQGDCDDSSAGSFPGAGEYTDGQDNDCDGQVDEEVPTTDGDGDGYSPSQGDCDDGSDTTYPGADETADGEDNNCDGQIDEGTSASDDDGDGYSEDEGDCDDGNIHTGPNGTEYSDGEDNDCDGDVDEDTDTSDDDGDGLSESQGDCDDTRPDVGPGETETADGADNNCDGQVDEGTTGGDADGDGYSADDGDCDDTDPAVNPGEAEDTTNGVDDNCNGQVDEGAPDPDDDADGDGYTENEGDCDDTNANTNPDADEYQDGLDNDCDEAVDEDLETTDDDGDGVSEAEGDCDDDNANTFPGGSEYEDDQDNDCDGVIDDNLDSNDDDGDGVSEDEGDCNDDDDTTSPDEDEVLGDGVDNNCDGQIDEGGPNTGEDVDEDGYTEEEGDCDDLDPDVNPGAEDVADGIDNDCDGDVDDEVATEDLDDDGYTEAEGDCDDLDPDVNPGAEEDPDNGQDDDCDGETDEVAPEEPGDITLSDSEVDFGNVVVGDTESLSVTVRNVGDGPLTLTAITAVPVDYDDDEIMEGPTLSGDLVIQPGDSFKVNLSFSPKEARAYNAVLVIESDDPEDGELEVDMTGRGVVDETGTPTEPPDATETPVPEPVTDNPAVTDTPEPTPGGGGSGGCGGCDNSGSGATGAGLLAAGLLALRLRRRTLR